MWDKCLKGIRERELDQILANPAVDFAKKAKDGEFDSLSDEEYQTSKENVVWESALFGNKTVATASVLLLRALRELAMDEEIRQELAKLLGSLTSGFVEEEREEEMPDFFANLDFCLDDDLPF